MKVTDPDSGTEITLNGWDFGGQRVYRPTHQLFFSAPAVYLVVWKPREGPQQGFVKEWIKLVKHREPEAKILVVATHGGPKERQPDIDRQEIWDLFGKDTVIDFFHVDSKPDENGGATRHRRAQGGDRPRGSQPSRDGAHRSEALAGCARGFEETGEAYLPLEQVLDICREHKMDEDEARLFVRISSPAWPSDPLRARPGSARHRGAQAGLAGHGHQLCARRQANARCDHGLVSSTGWPAVE